MSDVADAGVKPCTEWASGTNHHFASRPEAAVLTTMAAKTSGVFRELPLFRFDEVEEWQTYRIPGEATCDASAAAAAISAAGQGTSTAAACAGHCHHPMVLVYGRVWDTAGCGVM